MPEDHYLKLRLMNISAHDFPSKANELLSERILEGHAHQLRILQFEQEISSIYKVNHDSPFTIQWVMAPIGDSKHGEHLLGSCETFWGPAMELFREVNCSQEEELNSKPSVCFPHVH